VYEDLEQLANLTFGKELERISAQTREALREAANRFAATLGAAIRSGQHDAELGRIRIGGVVLLARALCQVWVTLIEKRNGRITHPDVQFISGKIEAFVNAQKQHLYSAFLQQGGGATVTLNQEADQDLRAICANLRRDLAIKAREAELFPARALAGDNMPMQQAPKRFSPGRRVLKGHGMQPATVQSVADAPSTLGEFVHVVLVDGMSTPEDVLGCDLRPFPELDADLRSGGPNIHIQHSSVANVSIGSQIGVINASLQQMSEKGSDTDFVRAIAVLRDAIVAASMEPPQKQDLIDNLSALAEQGAKKPEERSKGTLKAILSFMPTAVSTVTQLSTLWDKYAPVIKAHLGL